LVFQRTLAKFGEWYPYTPEIVMGVSGWGWRRLKVWGDQIRFFIASQQNLACVILTPHGLSWGLGVRGGGLYHNCDGVLGGSTPVFTFYTGSKRLDILLIDLTGFVLNLYLII